MENLIEVDPTEIPGENYYRRVPGNFTFGDKCILPALKHWMATISKCPGGIKRKGNKLIISGYFPDFIYM